MDVKINRIDFIWQNRLKMNYQIRKSNYNAVRTDNVL